MIAEYKEHKWVYTYPPEEANGMIDVLADQAMRGKLPVVLADTLINMVVEGVDAGI